MTTRRHESREPADRIHAALDRLQLAQNELMHAAEALSSIRGFSPEHTRTLKLFDTVRAHWYKIRDAGQRKAGKLSLDELALRACDERDAKRSIQDYEPCPRHPDAHTAEERGGTPICGECRCMLKPIFPAVKS